MTDSSNRYKIEKSDFGFSSNIKSGISSKSSSIFTKGAVLPSKSSLVTLIKRAFLIFGRTKWKISRSIFLGRGIYFKYISNLSILIIVIFGTFVYLHFYSPGNKQSAFLPSKYAKGAEAETVQLRADNRAFQQDQIEKPLSIVKYTVADGDTLSTIAKKFSTAEVAISVDSIKYANNLKGDDLKPGSLLDIPPVSGTIHTVEKGQSIIDIGKKYGKIKDVNNEIEVFTAVQGITNDNVLDVRVEGDKKVPIIFEGQRLIISGGVVPEAPKPIAVAQQAPQRTSTAQQPQTIRTASGYIWPVQSGIGTITQYFTSGRLGYGHTGVDIADFSGPALVAIAPGTVISTGWEQGGGGCVVRVRFDDVGPFKNMSGLYAHTQCNYRVSAGQRVTQGQILANMGSTGRSTGTHLHFEMFQDGYFVNPFNFIRR